MKETLRYLIYRLIIAAFLMASDHISTSFQTVVRLLIASVRRNTLPTLSFSALEYSLDSDVFRSRYNVVPILVSSADLERKIHRTLP